MTCLLLFVFDEKDKLIQLTRIRSTQWRIQGGGSIRPCPHPIVEQLFNYKKQQHENTIRKKCIHCGQLILG